MSPHFGSRAAKRQVLQEFRAAEEAMGRVADKGCSRDCQVHVPLVNALRPMITYLRLQVEEELEETTSRRQLKEAMRVAIVAALVGMVMNLNLWGGVLAALVQALTGKVPL